MLFVVAACAFALRAIYLLQTSGNPFFGFHVVDALAYEEMAQPIIAHNQWLWHEPTNYTPVYPWIIAGLRLSFGDSVWTLKIAQHLAGVASAVLMMLIGTRFLGRKTGVIAGLIYALYWPVVIYESEQFAETLSLFFSLLAVWMAVKPDAKKLESFLAGLAWAIASLLRPNLLLALPVLICWIAWRHRKVRLLFIRDSLLLAVGFGLLILPILWRNHALTGKWLLRRQASWSLYSGLDPAFAGRAIPPGVQFNNFMTEPHRAGAQSVTEIEHYWKEKIHVLLADQKAAVAWNLARRAAMLTSATEYSKEFDLTAYRQRSSVIELPWPGWWLIFPLACAGIFTLRRGRPGTWLILLLAIALAASIVPFKLSDRYRLALVPFLTLLAAQGAVGLWKTARDREWRRLALQGGVLGLGALASWPDWFALNSHRIARHDFFLGTALAAKGKQDEALAAFHRSMQEFPWDADSAFNAAQILHRQKGNSAAAITMLEEALRRESRFPEALDFKTEILLNTDRKEEAIASVKAAMEIQPTPARALSLARALRKAGKANEALAAYQHATETMTDASARLETALYLDELGHTTHAITILNTVVLNQAPSTAHQRGRLYLLLGILHIRSGNADQAATTWMEAEKSQIGDAFTKKQISFLLEKHSEEEWRKTLASPDAEIEFTIALRRQLEGKPQSAAEAYRTSLQLSAFLSERRASDPHRWAREALARLPK